MSKRISIELDDFGWDRLSDEAAHQGVTMEVLAAHAVLYYLADADSGRLARKVPRAEPPPPAKSKSSR